MKLTAINGPANGREFEVVISDETGEVRKTIRHSDAATGFLYAIREAERDIAYNIFGDEWRKHVGHMWGDVRPHELRMAEKARELRPDIFGAPK